jgi:hypothetical protein
MRRFASHGAHLRMTERAIMPADWAHPPRNPTEKLTGR